MPIRPQRGQRWRKDKLNLINEIDKIKNIDYYVINGFNLSDEEVNDMIDKFNNNNYKDKYIPYVAKNQMVHFSDRHKTKNNCPSSICVVNNECWHFD